MEPDRKEGLAGRTGSARRCGWLVAWGPKTGTCGKVATQYDPDTGGGLCADHAEDYADVFGWESLRSLEEVQSPNATASATGEKHEGGNHE